MIKLTKRIDDPKGIVSKLVFEDESAIAETVVYQFKDRGVVCFSVMSGCPVGCTFCGTGNRFIRDLTKEEISLQIETGLKVLGTRSKIQLMAMSMGEPMLNWIPVENVALEYLSRGYYFFISTVGIKNPAMMSRIYRLGQAYKKFGLQFSLHRATDAERAKLFRNTELLYMTIDELIGAAEVFQGSSGNKAYFNYIVTNKSSKDLSILIERFKNFHITCSVMCNTKKMTKSSDEMASKFADKLFKGGVEDVSIFDPAGQDTIGGGCGQLLYVQEKLNANSNSGKI